MKISQITAFIISSCLAHKNNKANKSERKTCTGEPDAIHGGVWTCGEFSCTLQGLPNYECKWKTAKCKKGNWKVNKKTQCYTLCPNTGEKATILFEDDFSFFNLEKWQHEQTLGGGGNWEFQYYTNNRSNSYVHDNTLYIKPTFMADYSAAGENMLTTNEFAIHGSDEQSYCTSAENWGCARTGSDTNYLNPIISARIRTMKSFYFKYGTVRFQAKMPRGDWLWPAVWLLPKYGAYGGWPASGEIDIIEARGNLDLKCGENPIDKNCIASTLHWGPKYDMNRYYLTTEHNCDTDYTDGFHDYRLEWNENGIKTFVDDKLVLHVNMNDNSFWNLGAFPEGINNPWQYNSNMAPFDQEMYLIINLAVGGSNGYFPDECTNGNGAKPWLNSSPTAPKDFWLARSTWEPTWGEGEDRALQIRNFEVNDCV